MKFKILVKNKNEEWWEDYNINTDDPEKLSSGMVNSFNDSLRPGESPRKLLKVEIISEKNIKHDWIKRTDGMSVLFRGEHVDLIYCGKCGITGKRYGMGNPTRIDSKYRLKKYQTCTWQEEN